MDQNPQSEELPYNRRVVAVMRRRDELSFEELVREMRKIEAEFIARAGDDEARVLGIKRSMSEILLIEAEICEQTHEVCRELWNEVVERGMPLIEDRDNMSTTYARCCQFNGEFDAGIAVLEPRIAELEQLLSTPALTRGNRFYCEENLRYHNELLDKLKARIREPEEPDDDEPEDETP